MTTYSVISQQFNDEFNNGSTFASFPSVYYSIDLKANVGDRVKFTQQIQISVTVNNDLNKTISYDATADATYGIFTGIGINWLNEGVYIGATLDVSWGSTTAVSVTVQNIMGAGFSQLRVTKANLTTAGIVDDDVRNDFLFKLTSVPDTLTYKYGLNPNGSSDINYTSWFDTSMQAYAITNLSGSLQSLTRVGLGIKSWDLSESVQAKYDGTVGTYFHQYTVEHIFKIPFYVDGEYENINDGTSPVRFNGTDTVTYDNGWFFGGNTPSEYIKCNLKGGIGRVGYFNENFNGLPNNYAVQNVTITNADNSGVLESTVVNTVTFQVKKNNGAWIAATDRLIIRHAKLPTETEYSNKTETFDAIWITDQIQQTEGAAAAAGTAVLSNCTVTINADTTLLDVSVDVTYDAGEQARISNTSNYLLYVTAGATPAIADDRVTMKVDLGQFSKNLDVTGLVSTVDVEFYEPFEFYSGSRRIVSWTGWDGDLGGVSAIVTKTATTSCVISKAQFKIISTDGNEEINLLTIDVPIGKVQTSVLGGNVYQIMNVNTLNSFTFPTNNTLNRIVGSAEVPPTPTATQAIEFRLGFQTPWRDWVFNNTVPNSEYNSSLPQNNQNYKTSNYSNNTNGFEVFAVWDFTLLTSGGVETIYRKETAESDVYDFDDNAGTFTATTRYYNESGVEIFNVLTDENVKVVIEFAHALGTITTANIEGYVWIERDQSDLPPWFLHTSVDLTKVGHPLQPTDTLLTGNTQFVEVVSTLNLVKLIFRTNKVNLQDGITYNIYGRIKNTTVV